MKTKIFLAVLLLGSAIPARAALLGGNDAELWLGVTDGTSLYIRDLGLPAATFGADPWSVGPDALYLSFVEQATGPLQFAVGAYNTNNGQRQVYITGQPESAGVTPPYSASLNSALALGGTLRNHYQSIQPVLADQPTTVPCTPGGSGMQACPMMWVEVPHPTVPGQFAWVQQPDTSVMVEGPPLTNVSAIMPAAYWESGVVGLGGVQPPWQAAGAVGSALAFYNLAVSADEYSTLTLYGSGDLLGLWSLDNSGALSYSFGYAPVAAVPELGTIMLLTAGLLPVGFIARRRLAVA